MSFTVGIDGGTYIGLVVCVTMLLFIVTMRSFDRAIRMRYIHLTIAMLIAFLAAILDMSLASLDHVLLIRYAAKIIKYVSQGFMEYFVLLIVLKDVTMRYKMALLIPLAMMIITVLSAPFCNDVFYFTEDNHFVRGILGNVIFIQAAIFVVMAMLTCVRKWFDGYQKDAVVILLMLFIVCVGVVLEENHIFPNCALESSATGCLFLYIYTYAEKYNVDSVSKCYKRRCFYADAAKYAKHEMMIISMDLNDLKYINDNFGHKAGDIALLTFAEVCRSVKTNKFILYRTGGDEFMMLGIKATKEEAEELVGLVKEKLSETPYACSFGIYGYKPGDDFDAAIVKADKAMYEDKNIYKISKTKRSRSRNDAIDNKLETFTNNISFLG